MTGSPDRRPADAPEATAPQSPAPGRRRVLLAAPRGYCAGVDRAVIAVEKALEQYGAPIYVRHEIVHNKYVVQTLEKKGAIFVEETDEVPEGEIVIFSAHGVAPTVHKEAERGKLATIDATCPLVTKVHKEAVRYAQEDYDILLIGHDGHEEVIGTSGEAPDHITLVDGPKDVENVEVRDPEKVVWLSQTTLSVDETMETVDALKGRYPNLLSPPSDDICYATQNRQTAIKQVAAEADLVLVVGSKNSSNSVRLVETALTHGARDGHLVDNADEIDEAWLEGVETIGLSSGASVPEVLVDGVLEWLAQRGWDEVEIVKPVDEHMQFSLPKELRRDLRAEAAERLRA
ncbi:4-hydroxy-3-methylbut-2-enyl diphosphate reductase [Streptomyces sp. 3N207]|uniref:4-hydroxy-3-methylbut-2-enyl diphosphate reductase n=1 Tax=Streptomyces sp. 3N207 TaxID=3457417 RepID=UPI003FD3E6B7